MTLRDLLHRIRFDSEVKSETFRFRNEIFEVFRAKRSEALLPNTQFSEYFFLEVSGATMTKMTEEEDLSYFRDFQAKLLSKPFFSYKSDMRWNLYLIIVIQSYELLKESSILHKIENDPDYARKFVITPADTLSWLDKEWLQSAAADKTEQADPLKDWTDQLKPVQLTGCLTQTFGKEHVNQYLLGHPFLSEEIVSTSRKRKTYAEYEEKIATINSISLEGFRQHCFADLDPIHPTNVNLFHGSNGSGKTSAMEAIELALTNEIQRCSEFGDSVEKTANQIQVLCQTESGKSLSFKAGKPIALYKKLAQSWYGVTSGRQSELNYYFHRFNYFDSEAAYRFALNESGHADHEKFEYSDNLSKLVYGDSILETHNKWQRYKEEFDEQLNALTKQKTEMSSFMTTLEGQISSLSQIESGQPVNMNELLTSIHIRDSKVEQETDKNTLDYLESLNFVLKSIEPRRKEIIEFPQSNVTLTLEHAQSQLSMHKEKFDLLMKDKDGRVSLQGQLKSEQDRVRSELRTIEERQLLLHQSLDGIKNHMQEWQDIRKVIEEPSQVQMRRRLEQRSELLNKKLIVLQWLEARFSRLSSLTNYDLLLLPRDELDQLLRTAEEKRTRLTQLETQIEAVKKMMGEVNTLISRIQHLGNDFLEIDANSTTCPLCKHDHGTHSELTRVIQSAKSVSEAGENNIDELHKIVGSLQTDISLLDQKIGLQNTNSWNVEQVAEAYVEIAKDLLFDFNIHLKKPEDQLQSLQSLLREQSEWKSQRDVMQNQLNVLDEIGFSNNTIIRAELFQKENSLYKEYNELQSANSFEAYTIARQKEWQNEVTELTHISAQLRNQDNVLHQRLQQILFEELSKSIEEQEKQMGLWSNIKESMEILLLDFDLDQQDNLRVWAIQLEYVRTQIQLIIEKHKSEQKQEQLRSEWEKAEYTLQALQSKIGRCELACRALGQLRALKTYTEEFIHKNISQIQRFFKLLHTPREFDEIRLEDDGLTMYRKWDGHAVKAFQMSSGQRASLALSVMFAVHLAAPSAPKFIIMDEPVANMDDLHLMNLLDLLRDLALSGRQIFFTTANPDVANLFRRKFSFFQEHFTHFEFTRHSGEPVHIQSRNYSPDRESPLTNIS